MELAKLLIEHGADVNVAKEDSWAMDLCADAGGPDLDSMENAGTHDANEWTPLHDAAARGFADEAEMLVKHGADISVTDANGDTPIDVARSHRHPEIAGLLLRFRKSAP